MEKDTPGIYEAKKSEVALLMSGQMGFKVKNLIKDKKGHCVLVKEI